VHNAPAVFHLFSDALVLTALKARFKQSDLCRDAPSQT